MHQAAIYAVIALWLMPGAIWRPVALALLVTWGLCEGWYVLTGAHIPTDLYYACDAAILLTAAARRSHWSDLLVIPLIVAQWRWYPVPVTRESWTWLYWLALAQFVIAGPWPQIMRGLQTYSHGPRRPLEFKG